MDVFALTLLLSHVFVSILFFFECEGNLAATSVTPMIARVDLAHLVGRRVSSSSLTVSSVSLPKLHACSVKEEDLP